jgi:predicted lipoprotein with Yx(FWY)xxD motif
MLLKRSFLFSLGLLLAVLITACGSNTATNTTGSSNPSVIIKTATATIKGNSKTILTNVDGKTLYYFTSDTATTAACTGSCLSTWPALLSNSSTATSSSTLPGKLSVQTDANGNQVEYNGHPLYLYSGDTAAGQTNGEGLFGKWFVATSDLSSQGGGYGY